MTLDEFISKAAAAGWSGPKYSLKGAGRSRLTCWGEGVGNRYRVPVIRADTSMKFSRYLSQEMRRQEPDSLSDCLGWIAEVVSDAWTRACAPSQIKRDGQRIVHWRFDIWQYPLAFPIPTGLWVVSAASGYPGLQSGIPDLEQAAEIPCASRGFRDSF